MIKGFSAALLVFLMTAGSAHAAGETGHLKSSGPIKIKSDELSTDTNKRTATFIGKVSARQGDMTIYSDRLVITYAEKDQEVETVEATGNVRIIQGDRQAVAGRAVYQNKAGKITLDESPKVFQGTDVVSGKVITYFVDEEKSVVTGSGNERVEAVIHPGEKGKNGPRKP